VASTINEREKQMSALFLLTVDSKPNDPRDAAKLVQTMGEDRLLKAIKPRAGPLERPPGRTIVELTGDRIILRHDCVLLMMGITDDLVDGIQQVTNQGYKYIQSCWFDEEGYDRRPVDEDIDQWHWYVRFRTTLTRKETLIAIATWRYWKDADGISGHQTLRNGWERMIGTQELYYCNLDEPPRRDRDLNRTTYLLDMVRECQGQDWWIKPR
jgi:hypothetical protein